MALWIWLLDNFKKKLGWFQLCQNSIKIVLVVVIDVVFVKKRVRSNKILVQNKSMSKKHKVKKILGQKSYVQKSFGPKKYCQKNKGKTIRSKKFMVEKKIPEKFLV